MTPLREIRAQGDPYQLGYQHGAQVPDLIRAVAEGRAAPIARKTGEDLAAIARRSRQYLPVAEQHFPDLVEEIHGLADGARIPFDVAFFIQVASELDATPEPGPGTEGCSAMAVSRPDGVVIGQNWDVPESMAGKQIILHLRPTGKPEALMFTNAGVIGYMGLNSHGLAHVANQLLSPGWRVGATQYFLKRRFLEQRTVEDCLAFLSTVPVSSSANYVMADGSGRVVDIEMAPEGCRILEGGGCQVHANHFTHPDLVPLERYLEHLPDSAVRHRRLAELAPARATVADFQVVFRDHHNYPESICRHASGPGAISTAASVIMEPGTGRMHVAPGNPCQVPYQTFTL